MLFANANLFVDGRIEVGSGSCGIGRNIRQASVFPTERAVRKAPMRRAVYLGGEAL